MSCMCVLQAQNLKILNGKVTSDIDDLTGIAIKNVNQNYEKVTSSGGYFSLKVELNDTLIFTSDYLYEYKHVVSDFDFKTDLLQIRMVKMKNILDEVVVYSDLDPVALGILQKPAKKYTVAERRLYTSQTGPVDIIINSISGRTKQLKKLVMLDRQTNIENKLISLYGASNLTTDFNIPEDYLFAFSQYACTDTAVKSAIEANNKKLLSFLLIQISTNFIIDNKL